MSHLKNTPKKRLTSIDEFRILKIVSPSIQTHIIVDTIHLPTIREPDIHDPRFENPPLSPIRLGRYVDAGFP